MISQAQPARHFFAFPARLLLRLLFVLVALTLVLGVAAPYLDADAFRGSIQGALQETLGRKVEIGKVRFTLFTGPGFTLERVTIQEDPHYGLEPFAFVPTLEVRVRLDKLLLGQIRPLGLRLIDASLNLVKSDDGTWNAVALVERLGVPRRAPFNFFPAVQISDARIDFKLGTRKTTFYLMETAVSVYPESSGKIYFKFDGSPARTDRAGNGFGHFAGTANWYLQPAPASGNQLEADVNLAPSNLSELATLLQGQDLGVHGNVSAHVLISGPFSNLHALGDMRLDDVHRWDLLPSPGDSWRVRFRALIDLQQHTLEIATLPLSPTENPLMLQLKAKDFMTRPAWSLLMTMQKAPLASLLPLARRMGMALPDGLQMDGALDGVVGFSSAAGLSAANLGSAGLEGGVVVTNAVATIPNLPPLRSASATVTISGNKIHIDPAILQSDAGGTLRTGGDFDFATQNMLIDMSADQFSIAAFKQTTNAWFGSPQAMVLLDDGHVSGHFRVSYPASARLQTPPPEPGPLWSGQAQFYGATLHFPGLAVPVTRIEGKATFDHDTFDLTRMAGLAGELPFTGSYHYAVSVKHTERLRLEFRAADLVQIEADLAPTLRDNGLLSRLPFTRRPIPPWLAARNMEGEVAIAECSLNQAPLGPLSAHFVWQGAAVQLSDFTLGLPAGNVSGSGTIALSARLPRYHFSGKVDGYPWNGGTLRLTANLDTAGTGMRALQQVQASGEFAAAGVSFTGFDPLEAIAGQFLFAFNGVTPELKLSKIQARQDDTDWLGQGNSSPDGKLQLDLTSGDRQLHLVTEIPSIANGQ